MIEQFHLTNRWILTGITNPGPSRLESNGNEEVLLIPQSFRTGASLSDAVLCPNQDTATNLGEGKFWLKTFLNFL